MKHTGALRIEHLHVSTGQKDIIHGVSMVVGAGEIHAIMGPNGSGKSTLAYALMGHPLYSIGKKSTIYLDGRPIHTLPTENRAKKGLYLAFQSPITVPGVSVMNFLRSAYEERFGKAEKKTKPAIHNPVLAKRWHIQGVTIADFMDTVKMNARALGLAEDFLMRSVNEGFSGGEKKKLEMLCAVTVSPAYMILDEIDTGLDVDALKTIAKAITTLQSQGTGVLIITHYQRILKYIRPTKVHILVNGKIVQTGNASLAKTIEHNGYSTYVQADK